MYVSLNLAILLHNYRDSFESESPSEAEDDDDGKETPPSPLHQPSHTTSKSASSATSERRDRRARKDRPESDRSKGRGEIKKKGRTSGSYGSGGSQSAGSSTNKMSSAIRVGDKVVVYLPSGGKAKGTVSAESSRDRYEITLENGDVEKRVHSRNIEPARRHRHKHGNGAEDLRRKSLSGRPQQQQKGSPRRQESQHEKALEDRQDSTIHDALLSESGSQTPRDHHHSGSSSSPRDNHSPSSSSAAGAHKDDSPVVGGRRPSSPASQGLSTMTSAASGGGDPAEQPPEVESHSPDTAPTGQTTLTPIEAPASESEPDTSNGERGSSSERRSSTPLSSRLRQAQRGLLKTVRPTMYVEEVHT